MSDVLLTSADVFIIYDLRMLGHYSKYLKHEIPTRLSTIIEKLDKDGLLKRLGFFVFSLMVVWTQINLTKRVTCFLSDVWLHLRHNIFMKDMPRLCTPSNT